MIKKEISLSHNHLFSADTCSKVNLPGAKRRNGSQPMTGYRLPIVASRTRDVRSPRRIQVGG